MPPTTAAPTSPAASPAPQPPPQPPQPPRHAWAGDGATKAEMPMVAAAANVNAAFFISEASVVPGTSTDSPAIVSLRPRLAEGLLPNLILMNGLGKRNDAAATISPTRKIPISRRKRPKIH